VRVAGAGEEEEARLEEVLRRDFQTISHTQQQAHLAGQPQFLDTWSPWLHEVA
jgi:hypothetical protein